MSIDLVKLDSTGTTIICVQIEDLDSFKELVRRAMNTWQEPPIELLEFADKLLEGKVLQDYKALRNIPKA